MKPKTTEKLHNVFSSKIVSDSVIGTTHKVNEDKNLILFSEDYAILAVFDGVSSAKNNELATSVASDYIHAHHAKYYSNQRFRLDDMIVDLNKKILARSESDSSALATCAICVLLLENNTLLYLNLGDSRIYAVGKHYVTKLTKDDVVYPGSNVITKCLGLPLADDDVSQSEIDNFKDDLLLCSDGFYKLYEETKLAFFEVLIKRNAATIKNNLHNLIADKNRDDASYVLFKNV